jgi:arylsulfate sulfotransferase
MKLKASDSIRIMPTESSCLTALGLTKSRSRNPFLRNAMVCCLTLTVVGVSWCSNAVTILSVPIFTKATNAPLAGTLRLTTDVASRVSVAVDDGYGSWQRNFYDFGTTHSVPLLGFKPNRTHQITVTAYDRQQNQDTPVQPIIFVTDPLPANFPNIVLLQSDPASMEPGYTLFRVGVHNELYWYVVIVDSSGEVVWYNVAPSTADVRRLDNGDLFMPWKTNFVEMNLLGQIVNSWVVPTNLPINLHDGVPTDHGTILYLSDAVEVVTNYPSSMTNSNAPRTTANVRYQKVVEISATNATVLNTWPPINLLDPRRISYLIVSSSGSWDSEHSNAVIEDSSDNSIIVSMCMQNAVVKFSRATGQLRWILGPPANWGPAWQPYLLTPVGNPFVWQYGQHAPILTPQGTLIMHDNGNYRASPFAPIVSITNYYSRAVEYSINEQTMQVSQVWDYGRTNVAERLYSDHEGNAEPLPMTGNVLIDFAAVSYDNGKAPSSFGVTATMSRITEVTHDVVPQIVFDLGISMYANSSVTYKDCSVYRSHRIPDLYAHPALPVADLSVTCDSGAPFLEFSADDTRNYVIEASTNLVDWEEIGQAFESEQHNGDYTFNDDQSSALPARYYRVITQ